MAIYLDCCLHIVVMLKFVWNILYEVKCEIYSKCIEIYNMKCKIHVSEMKDNNM